MEQTRRAARFWVLSAATITLAASQVKAFDAQVSWSLVQSVAGYRVYVRQTGQPYAGGTDVGLLAADTGGVVRYIAGGLTDGVVNYVAVTAYDGSGAESGLSNELAVSVVASPTATVTRSATATATGTGASATETRTATFAAPPTMTATAAATRTATWTMTRTASPTASPTPSPTPKHRNRRRTPPH